MITSSSPKWLKILGKEMNLDPKSINIEISMPVSKCVETSDNTRDCHMFFEDVYISISGKKIKPKSGRKSPKKGE